MKKNISNPAETQAAQELNSAHSISSSIRVRVIPTRKDLMIARSILHIIPNRRAKSREFVSEAKLKQLG